MEKEYKDAAADLRNIIGKFENEEFSYAAVNLCLAIDGKRIFSPFLRTFEDSSPDDVIRMISIEEIFKMAMQLLVHQESVALHETLHIFETWIVENKMTNRGNYEIDEYRHFKFVLTADLIKRWTKQLTEEKSAHVHITFDDARKVRKFGKSNAPAKERKDAVNSLYSKAESCVLCKRAILKAFSE